MIHRAHGVSRAQTDAAEQRLTPRPRRRSICFHAIYGEHKFTDGMEKRQRRAPHSFARRSSPAPRLRNQQTHRATLRGHGAFSCRLALPDALPSGTTRLASWTVGRKKRTTPSPLLSCNSPGPQSPRFAASRLARICRWHQSHHGGRKCLNGNLKFSAALLH